MTSGSLRDWDALKRAPTTRKAGPSKSVVVAVLSVFAALVSSLISGCSNSGSSSSNNPGSPSPTANVQAISVNTGPALSVNTVAVNSAFTSITICVPNSTSQCQTIDGILVDTGSSGVRVLSSALTLTLPQQKDSSGNSIGECTQFVSNEVWGPVQMADVVISGEKASSQPIQVIGSSSFPAVPTSCSSHGPVDDTLATFGANGILGVGNFIQDCGGGCTLTGSSNPGFYYTCPSSGCVVTTEALAQQVSNPVFSFATDNNGVLVELPAATAPQTSLSGSLIFGIGTRSNNGLGGATVYAVNPSTSDFTTIFKGTSYTAFLDTGSNAIYFLDVTTTGMPTCPASSNLTFWYCPSSVQSFTATNQAFSGVATTNISFSIDNAQKLTSNQGNAVAPDLGGPNSGGGFDWGLPFFYGRNVFVAVEGQTTPGGVGPYVAY
jgi:Protein of unknown function (DUF3443)